MTRDDIIRMAREAGFVEYEIEDYTPSGYDIRFERFAALVAAAEREACAKVCDELHVFGSYRELQIATLQDAAAAIRARGQEC